MLGKEQFLYNPLVNDHRPFQASRVLHLSSSISFQSTGHPHCFPGGRDTGKNKTEAYIIVFLLVSKLLLHLLIHRGAPPLWSLCVAPGERKRRRAVAAPLFGVLRALFTRKTRTCRFFFFFANTLVILPINERDCTIKKFNLLSPSSAFV